MQLYAWVTVFVYFWHLHMVFVHELQVCHVLKFLLVCDATTQYHLYLFNIAASAQVVNHVYFVLHYMHSL